MKKLYTFFVIFGFCHTLYAQQFIWDTIDAINKRVFGTPQCTDCHQEAVAGEMGGSVNTNNTSKNSKIKSGLPNVCRQYAGIVNPGDFDKGQFIRNQMIRYTVFQKSTRDMGNLCPRFSKFSGSQKLTFWTWFWGALALDESTCGTNNHAMGVNGKAIGEFQMEASLELRKAGGRPAVCLGVADISDFKSNASCAVAIMAGQIKKSNQVFGRPNYWQKLLRSGSSVYNLAAKFPGCR